MTPSEKWTKRFLELADTVASWSRDPSTKVGSVITDSKNRVVSLGFNGFPQGVSDDMAAYGQREVRLARTIHAEENALAFARRDLTNCAIYVTHPPCAHCTAMIIQSGIALVVFWEPEEAFADRWGADLLASAEMFREAGVTALGWAR